jgi:hypothetical protein
MLGHYTSAAPPRIGLTQALGSLQIFVDESGSFAPAANENSWNVVAALVMPEASRRKSEEHLRLLKLSLGHSHSDEIKLKDLSEIQLKAFLKGLSRIECALFVSGVDLGAQHPDIIDNHQKNQVEKILENRPLMLHQEGRELIDDLVGRVRRLSPQLYTQLVAQIDLLDQAYRSSTLFYAQRVPATLGSYRWRLDEKNSSRHLFEETMRYMAPPLLQARSVRDPVIFVEGFDYSHFERSFRYKKDEIPAYLQERTGQSIESGSSLGKILKDFAFVKSHEVPGVQIADLLASSYRRVLRDDFEDSLGIAKLLGALTVQRARKEPSIHLISLASDQLASGHVFDVSEAAKTTARSMLK